MKKNEPQTILVQFESEQTAPSLSELASEFYLVHLRETLEDYSLSDRRTLLAQLRKLLK